MTTSTSTLPRHADAIRRHMRAWGFHLHHDDPAFRLVALQEIREYIDALMVHEEQHATQPTPPYNYTPLRQWRHWLERITP